MAKKDENQQTAKVIPFKPEKTANASEKKWSRQVIDLGFCIVPSLLFRAQQRLGLNPTQLAVLMHLADYWWDVDRNPCPSKKTLAEHLNLSPRQVQRYLAELEKAGLISRIGRTAAHRGKITNEYDLSGLVKRLKKLEPEFREVENEVKARRRAVTRRGGIHRQIKKTD